MAIYLLFHLLRKVAQLGSEFNLQLHGYPRVRLVRVRNHTSSVKAKTSPERRILVPVTDPKMEFIGGFQNCFSCSPHFCMFSCWAFSWHLGKLLWCCKLSSCFDPAWQTWAGFSQSLGLVVVSSICISRLLLYAGGFVRWQLIIAQFCTI